MTKRMTIMLIATGLVFGAIFGFQAFKARMIQQFLATRGNPVQTVSAITAASQEWQSSITAVGSVRAVNGTNLSSQVAGTVSAIHFKSGTDVEKGAPLLELMAADDVARLQSLKAAAVLAKLTYDRDASLMKSGSGAVTKATVDADVANLKSADALAAQQQATVDYKFIRAPFAGRLGLRQVDLGQYLAGGTVIVTLQQLDPVHVIFYVPQQALAEIKTGQPVAVKADTYPDQEFPGEITAINSLVDAATRNVAVEATCQNPDKKLLPGMFVTVDIKAGAPRRYVTLPSTAIAYNSFGEIAYLVDAAAKDAKDAKGQSQLTARQTFVTSGQTRGGQVAILKGVKEGDMVVTSGQVKLRNGVPVRIDNSVQPSASATPAVTDE